MLETEPPLHNLCADLIIFSADGLQTPPGTSGSGLGNLHVPVSRYRTREGRRSHRSVRHPRVGHTHMQRIEAAEAVEALKTEARLCAPRCPS